MKKLATLMLLILGAAAYSGAQDVKSTVASKNFTIVIDQICPVGGPMISSTDGYTLKVEDGVVDASLPYFGESHVAIYGGAGETGIRFDKVKTEIKPVVEKRRRKKDAGLTTWQFTAKSGDEDVDVTVRIWNGGRAEISCIPQNRTAITYLGEVIF